MWEQQPLQPGPRAPAGTRAMTGVDNTVPDLWAPCRGDGPEGAGGARPQPLLPLSVRDSSGGNLRAGSYSTGGVPHVLWTPPHAVSLLETITAHAVALVCGCPSLHFFTRLKLYTQPVWDEENLGSTDSHKEGS